MSKKKNIIVVEEAKPNRHGDSVFEVELEPGIDASPVRWIGRTDPKRWSITLTHVTGLQVVVRERKRGTIELESEFIDKQGDHLIVKPLGASKRVRTGTKVRHKAIAVAEEKILERYAEQLVRGDTVDPEAEPMPGEEPALNQVFAELRRRRALGGGRAQLRKYERVMDTASFLWDGAVRCSSEITQDDVNYWFGKRCGRRVDDIRRDYRFAAGDGPGIEFPASYNRRDLYVRNTSPWTAKTDFLELRAVFNEAVKHKIIPENPLQGLDFSDAQKGDRDPYYAERFYLVLPFLDEVDPTGALRFRVVLTYESAARPSTVEAIHVEDFLDSESEILAAVRRIRNLKIYSAKREKPLDDWAEAWAVENGAYGALYLRHLKGKGRTYVRIIPLNAVLRTELKRYLRRRRELAIDSHLLFPDVDHPDRPADGDHVRQQYREAEQMAREYWTANPEGITGISTGGTTKG